MATQTIINQTQLTPEQRALAQIELEQIKRRQGFEDFAGSILLGMPLNRLSGTGSGSATPPPTTPTPPRPVASPPTVAGGGPQTVAGSALGNAINSAVQLGNIGGSYNPGATITNPPPAGVNTPSSGGSSGVSLGSLIRNPELIGAVIGGAALGPGGIMIGKSLGESVGSILNSSQNTPEVSRPDTTAGNTTTPPSTTPSTGTTTPRVVSPEEQAAGESRNRPADTRTPGQISAERAAQTARDSSHFLAQSASAQSDMMGVMMGGLGGGDSGMPAWARAKTSMASTFDSKLAPALLDAGYSVTEIRDYFNEYMNGYEPPTTYPQWVMDAMEAYWGPGGKGRTNATA